jgi:hypothetical protein
MHMDADSTATRMIAEPGVMAVLSYCVLEAGVCSA